MTRILPLEVVVMKVHRPVEPLFPGLTPDLLVVDVASRRPPQIGGCAAPGSQAQGNSLELQNPANPNSGGRREKRRTSTG